MNQKTIIITGVSKGIGLATAHFFLGKNWRAVGIGRNSPSISHENFHFIPCKITNYSSVIHAINQANQLLENRVDVLLNNAGFGTFGSITELPIDKWEEMFQVNVHGLMYVTREVVPIMKKQQHGHIINISSIAGLNGIVNGSGYAATKHAVKGISHSLYAELRNDGIKVTAVYPGSVKTNFFDEVDGITANDNMLQPSDVAETIWYLANTSPNFLPVDFEIRPLNPNTKK
jgi:NADP-dependent 3-hydroxy acid dehydrogenase YdfG